jgi:hypothetical protein
MHSIEFPTVQLLYAISSKQINNAKPIMIYAMQTYSLYPIQGFKEQKILTILSTFWMELFSQQ